MKLYRGRTLRGKFFRVILVGVVTPLAVVGIWLSETTRRSGEGLIRNGSLAMLAVAAVALIVATIFTRRMARSMEELASATVAVASGDLDRRVAEHGRDEIAQVAHAFNTMTESLRATLRKLSQREALVAVGEFAASLAHEVRNPLTSIRVDLQRVEEQLPQDSPLRVQLGRALREVQRLDQTVSGALRIARSGSITSDLVDVRVPLERAIEIAALAFEQSDGTLSLIDPAGIPLSVKGDEAALEQLFLNVLLNAAQAAPPGGAGRATISTHEETVQIEIWDNGRGIPADQLDRVFEPFFSTRPDGTGLGLSVARQIAHAHGGSISAASDPGAGTTVRIRLPVARKPAEPAVPGFFRW